MSSMKEQERGGVWIVVLVVGAWIEVVVDSPLIVVIDAVLGMIAPVVIFLEVPMEEGVKRRSINR